MTGPADMDFERLAALDADVSRLATTVAELQTAVADIQGTLTGHGEALRAADDLKDTVGELLHRVNSLFPDDGNGDTARARFYTPIPAPRFWQLTGPARDQAVDRLRAWVRDVYVPVFGHLAHKLPACWDQHTLCLTVLDVLSELHSVLYLQATRNQGLLAGQAELLTRLMPALAALMAAETARCQHTQSGTRTPAVPPGHWSQARQTAPEPRTSGLPRSGA